MEPDWSLLLKSKLFSSFPGGSDDKEYACNLGDLGVIPGLGGSPRERNDYPLQYSCLENSMTEEPGRLESMGSHRVSHDLATNTSFSPRLRNPFFDDFALS